MVVSSSQVSLTAKTTRQLDPTTTIETSNTNRGKTIFYMHFNCNMDIETPTLVTFTVI